VVLRNQFAFCSEDSEPGLCRTACAHALDRQTLEMEAENLMFESTKRISTQAVITATSAIMPYSTTA
jgi:hypothetical protein